MKPARSPKASAHCYANQEFAAMTTRVKRSVGRPKHSPGAPDTREQILRKAERLFALQGYRGTSMREIASAAEVGLSVVVYHFKSKLKLYRALFERHRHVFEERVAELQKVDYRAADAVEQIAAAFVMPVIRTQSSVDGRFYSLLTVHETFDPEEQSRGIIRDFYDPLAKEFIACLQRALPDRSSEYVHWAYLFSVGALLINCFDDRMSRLSNNRYSPKDVPTKARVLVKYVAGGIRNGPTE